MPCVCGLCLPACSHELRRRAADGYDSDVERETAAIRAAEPPGAAAARAAAAAAAQEAAADVASRAAWEEQVRMVVDM